MKPQNFSRTLEYMFQYFIHTLILHKMKYYMRQGGDSKVNIKLRFIEKYWRALVNHGQLTP